MKLLMLSRYARLGASSRLRMMQFMPYLAASGVEVEVAPFFDDAYLEGLYGGQRAPDAALGYYVNRIGRLLRTARPDAFWLEKELLPWLPWNLERFLLPRGVALISDYDDAVFHRYDLHRRALVRTLLGRKIDRVMAASDLVLAGNPYLAGRALKAGAKRVEIVPTVVDAEAYSAVPLPADDGCLRIGWIGSPTTWEEYIAPMVPVLSELAARHDAVIRVVGAGRGVSPGPRFECFPWSEDSESQMIQGMDIGLMPLDDSPWARGKCGYKIIQYMACGVPVVASPVGVNAEIIEDGVSGLLASTESEWCTALERLLSDSDLRKRIGTAGRRRMEERYSLQVWGPRVAGLLREDGTALNVQGYSIAT